MPTTLTGAGVTFNDNSVQTTSAFGTGVIGNTQLANLAVTTAKLADNAVTAAKLGATERSQLCKAFVNFNGLVPGIAIATSSETISVTSGSNTGTYTATGFTWPSHYIGIIFRVTQIGGVANALLGGVDVSTLGIQVTSVSGSVATFRLLSGTATANQSVTGTGSGSSGWSYTNTGIRSSYNVSSITKNGTGDYTINFATPMADANYSISGIANSTQGAGAQCLMIKELTAPATTSVSIMSRQGNTASNSDVAYNCIQIFGN